MSDWDDRLNALAAARAQASRTTQPWAGAPYQQRATVETARNGIELIPGRADLVEDDAASLHLLAATFDDASTTVHSATTGEWDGMAADAYAELRNDFRKALGGASDALKDGATALDDFASTLRWAQRKAMFAADHAQQTAPDDATRKRHVAEANDDLAAVEGQLADAEDALNASLKALYEYLPPPPSKLVGWLNSAGDAWDGMPVWEQLLAVVAVSAAVSDWLWALAARRASRSTTRTVLRRS